MDGSRLDNGRFSDKGIPEPVSFPMLELELANKMSADDVVAGIPVPRPYRFDDAKLKMQIRSAALQAPAFRA